MYRTIAAAFVVATLAGPAQAAMPDAFDIVCQTTRVSQDLDAAGNPVGRPVTDTVQVRYSLDVKGDRWCEEIICRKGETSAFASRGPDVLMLDDISGAEGVAYARFTFSTSRFELALRPAAGVFPKRIEASGPCRLEAFTGPVSPVI